MTHFTFSWACLIAYAIGYVLCAVAALAAAVLALAAVRGRVHETLLDPQARDDSQAMAES